MVNLFDRSFRRILWSKKKKKTKAEPAIPNNLYVYKLNKASLQNDSKMGFHTGLTYKVL